MIKAWFRMFTSFFTHLKLREALKVKFLTQEHNTMSPVMARTRTARSGDERTSHEVTARLQPWFQNISLYSRNKSFIEMFLGFKRRIFLFQMRSSHMISQKSHLLVTEER